MILKMVKSVLTWSDPQGTRHASAFKHCRSVKQAKVSDPHLFFQITKTYSIFFLLPNNIYALKLNLYPPWVSASSYLHSLVVANNNHCSWCGRTSFLSKIVPGEHARDARSGRPLWWAGCHKGDEVG